LKQHIEDRQAGSIIHSFAADEPTQLSSRRIPNDGTANSDSPFAHFASGLRSDVYEDTISIYLRAFPRTPDCREVTG
jgi:hypothetical protein